MKKIKLSKETLRTLTAEESNSVGGGADSGRIPCVPAPPTLTCTQFCPTKPLPGGQVCETTPVTCSRPV